MPAATDSHRARRPRASMLSPSRTAASFCSSRAIRNTTPILCCANIGAMSRASSTASASAIRHMPHGYFSDEATALAEAFRRRALAERHGELIDRIPERRLRAGIGMPVARRRDRHSTKDGSHFCAPARPSGDRRRAGDGRLAANMARLAARRPPDRRRSGALDPFVGHVEFTFCLVLRRFNSRRISGASVSQPVVFAAPRKWNLLRRRSRRAGSSRAHRRRARKRLAVSADGTSSIMAWSCTTGRFNWHYHVDETLHIISGEVFVTDENGLSRRLGPGDMVFFPAGSSSVWHVTKDVRKLAFCRHSMPWMLRFCDCAPGISSAGSIGGTGRAPAIRSPIVPRPMRALTRSRPESRAGHQMKPRHFQKRHRPIHRHAVPAPALAAAPGAVRGRKKPGSRLSRSIDRTSATVSPRRGCTFQRMVCARPLRVSRSAGVLRIDVTGEQDRHLRRSLALRQQFVRSRRMCRRPMRRASRRGCRRSADQCGEAHDFIADAGTKRSLVDAAEPLQRLANGIVDKNLAAAVAHQLQRDFRTAAVGRHRQQQRAAIEVRRKRRPSIPRATAVRSA